MADLLSPRNDFVFKKLMGDPGHPEFLIGFIPAVLPYLSPEDVRELTIANPFLPGELMDDKQGVLDLKIVACDGRRINIEIQLRPQEDLRDRLVFYTARLAAEQLSVREEYATLAQSISIVIADHRMIEEDEGYHHRFRLYDAEAKVEFSDKLEIHALELPKLPVARDRTELWHWLRFFAAKNEEDYAMAVELPTVKRAYLRLKELSADEQTRQLAESREKARRDHAANMRGALEKGLAQGRMEGRLEITRNMLALQMQPEKIAAIVGLPLDEVLRIAREL